MKGCCALYSRKSDHGFTLIELLVVIAIIAILTVVVILTLQLHIAEYQALTNRSTYYIYISTTIWSILLLVLALIIPASQWNHGVFPYFIWLLCWVWEFSLLMWVDNARNQYHNIFYIEHRLRPLVVKLTNDSAFWLYEKYLAESRKGKMQWWESYPFWASPLALVGATAFRTHAIIAGGAFHKSNFWDIVGFTIAFTLTFRVVKVLRQVVELRRSFFIHTSKVTPQNRGS